MRQHVNPLSRFFQLPLELPPIENIFYNPNLPLHIDIGCAKGLFLLELADTIKEWNFLGIEIRKPLVLYAEKQRKNLEINNLVYLYCNANISLPSWIESLPLNTIQSISIQFPDPWFKRRHFKRRVLQPSLVQSISSSLQTGKELFIQSDVKEVIEQMNQTIIESGYFDFMTIYGSTFGDKNPFPFESEREKYVLNRGGNIFRVRYLRNNTITEFNPYKTFEINNSKI